MGALSKILILALSLCGLFFAVKHWYPKAWEYGPTVQGYFIGVPLILGAFVVYAVYRMKAK